MTKESTPIAPGKPTSPAPGPAEEAPGPMPPSEAPIGVGDGAGREPGDLVIAMSPRQILGGFALLAGLIVMLRRRRRNRD